MLIVALKSFFFFGSERYSAGYIRRGSASEGYYRPSEIIVFSVRPIDAAGRAVIKRKSLVNVSLSHLQKLYSEFFF